MTPPEGPPPNIPPVPPPRFPVLRQALGAIAWGIFFVTMPVLEVLILTSPLWIILLMRREARRARKYGFWKGALVRLAVVTIIVVGATLSPKALDVTVYGGLPQDISFQDLVKRADLEWHDPAFNPTLHLPRSRMSRREILDEIERQTGLKARVAYCGNTVSILSGAYPIFVALDKPTPPP